MKPFNQIYKDNKIEIYLLIALTVVAIATRFYNIDNQILWWDEFGTHFFSKWNFDDIAKTDNNSPTYYLLEGWIVKTFGKTELSIKFVSALFGALCVPLMYLISEKLFSSKKVAFVTSLLTLLSPVLIFYSQEARGFSFAMFFYLVSFLAFLFIISNNSWASWLTYAICGAISIHIQYVFAIPFVIFSLFILIWLVKNIITEIKKGSRPSGITKPIVSVLLFTICVSPIAYAITYSFKTSISLPGTWYTGRGLINAMLSNFLFEDGYIVLTLIILMLIGLSYLLAEKTDKCLLLLALSVIPIVIMLILSPQTHVHQRYMLYIAPIFYIIAATPLLILNDKKKITNIVIVAICSFSLIFAVCPVLDQYYSEPQTGNFKELSGILDNNIEDGDCIVYCPMWLYWGFEGGLSFYYDSENKSTPILKVDNLDQLMPIIDDPQYNNVYVLLYSTNDIDEWAQSSGRAEKIYHGCVIAYKIS